MLEKEKKKFYPLTREHYLSNGPKEKLESILQSQQYLGQDKYFV